jgi:hypothetical protein
MSEVGLQFMRWLNVRVSDFARIMVNDQLVWESPAMGSFDNAWTKQLIDISAIADNNPSVTVTFELKTNSSASSGGWNIDDVIVGNGLAAGLTSVETAYNQERPFIEDPRPNPFSDQTVISYYLPAGGAVELVVFNQSGITVKTLVSGHQPSGIHEIVWDGTNSNGQALRPGIYFYRLKTADFTGTKRLILLN